MEERLGVIDDNLQKNKYESNKSTQSHTLYGMDAKTVCFLWVENLRTENELIDRQHQSLYTSFNGISTLLDLPDMNITYWISMTMRLIDDYVLTHFLDEQQLMADAGYPDFHRHVSLHIRIIEDLKQYQQEIKQLTTQEEKITAAKKLLHFFSDWFNAHILTEDVRLAKFINGNK